MGDQQAFKTVCGLSGGLLVCVASMMGQSWSVHGVAWQWGLFTSRLETRTKESTAEASGMVCLIPLWLASPVRSSLQVWQVFAAQIICIVKALSHHQVL